MGKEKHLSSFNLTKELKAILWIQGSRIPHLWLPTADHSKNNIQECGVGP
jgi:hypothetical protein